MSYAVDFRVKIEGVNKYRSISEGANITWNVRKIIELATGLPWKNEANNGLCTEIMPCIERGLCELQNNPEKYKLYEAANGWGTVEGTIRFFRKLLKDWSELKKDDPELAKVATFWIC